MRRHAFRYRYETGAELDLLNEPWTLVMARKNHGPPPGDDTATYSMHRLSDDQQEIMGELGDLCPPGGWELCSVAPSPYSFGF